MKNFIQKITNELLDSQNMELYSVINNTEYQNYFKEKSSKEHYRLLTYLANHFDNQTFVDVGTLKGCSALALSHNKTNKVFSFNLVNQLELNTNLENVEFIVDNVINGKYDEILLKSKFILLDTYHDGTFELEFLNYLKKLNYEGFLILDDIHLNNEMKLFWDNLKENKLDITNIGHTSGTGVVFFY